MVRFFVVVALMFVAGCAVVSPPEIQVQQQLVDLQTLTLREPGKLVASDVQVEGIRVSATLRRQILCRDVNRVRSEHQKYQVRTIDRLASSMITGGIATATGGVLLGVAHFLSNSQLTLRQTEISGDTIMYVAGAVTAAAGVILLAYGTAKAVEARDLPVGKAWTTSEDEYLGSRRKCGTSPARAQVICLRYKGQPCLKRRRDGPVLSLSLSEVVPGLCEDLSMLGKPFIVEFDRSNKEGGEKIASVNLNDCIRAKAVARLSKLVMRAAQPNNRQLVPADLLSASTWLEEAGGHLKALDTHYKGHAQIKRMFTEAAHALASTYKRVIDEALAELKHATTPDALDAALPRVLFALKVAGAWSSEAKKVWKEIYGAYSGAVTIAGAGAVKVYLKLLENDQVTTKCLKRSGDCPLWLTHQEVLEVVAPVEAALQGTAASLMKELRSLTRQARKSRNNKVAQKITQQIEAAKNVENICASRKWDANTEKQCLALSQAVAQIPVVGSHRLVAQAVLGIHIPQEATTHLLSRPTVKMYLPLQDNRVTGAYIVGSMIGARMLNDPITKETTEQLLTKAVGRVVQLPLPPQSGSVRARTVSRMRIGGIPVVARWRGEELIELRVGEVSP